MTFTKFIIQINSIQLPAEISINLFHRTPHELTEKENEKKSSCTDKLQA